jgi:hypothetical protein
MHLEPSDKNARRLFERGIEGPVTMLTCCDSGRRRTTQSCPSSHHRAPSPAAPPPTSTDVTPSRSSTPPAGSLEFIGIGGHYFIGPADERWDLVRPSLSWGNSPAAGPT